MPTLSAPNSASVSFNKPGGYLTVDCSSGSTTLVSWSGPGGTSGRRTVKNISEDVGPFVDGTTATVQALDGSCSYESSASVSGDGLPSGITYISDLASGTAPEDADQFAVARSASNRKLTWANLKAALSSLYATAAQGALADSAVQPEDLGTAASTNASAYATAAQGAKADTAAQVAGDLSGAAASPTVAKINGLTLPENPSTAGYSLQWNGSALEWAAGGGLPSGLTYSSNVFEQRNGTAAQESRIYRSYVGASDYGYTGLKQDATAGFILDSVHSGSVSAPTNLLAVRANGGSNNLTLSTSEFALSIAGGRFKYAAYTFECGPASAAADRFLIADATGIWRIGASASNGVIAALRFGGASATDPMLKRSGAAMQVRLADDSGFAEMVCKLPTSNPGPGILWNNAGTPAIGT